MSNLFLTLVIAFVIIVLAIACMAIGWLIKGRTKINQGCCNSKPSEKNEEDAPSTNACCLNNPSKKN